ncbi:hypothetical protein L6452_03707 [Arctium lappa]|uniref:Uncharacterized protein n=1 Tax=Arctium lappa TaxID=4217 RepID=A0ACB9FNH4_ARCLA|nr:hypothetical protein L6452_03707 [Arctium lappa]
MVAAKVPTLGTDVMIYSKSSIDKRTINHMRREETNANMHSIVASLQLLGDRLSGLEKQFWAYHHDWNRVHRKILLCTDLLRAAEFPRFPLCLCPPQTRIPIPCQYPIDGTIDPTVSSIGYYVF